LTFAPIASEITNGDAASGSLQQPFVPRWLSADPNMAFQQLNFNLVSKHGTNSNQTASSSTVTFTAINSTIPPPTGAICGENQTGARP
jgi:hypothetical protein